MGPHWPMTQKDYPCQLLFPASLLFPVSSAFALPCYMTKEIPLPDMEPLFTQLLPKFSIPLLPSVFKEVLTLKEDVVYLSTFFLTNENRLLLSTVARVSLRLLKKHFIIISLGSECVFLQFPKNM